MSGWLLQTAMSRDLRGVRDAVDGLATRAQDALVSGGTPQLRRVWRLVSRSLMHELRAAGVDVGTLDFWHRVRVPALERAGVAGPRTSLTRMLEVLLEASPGARVPLLPKLERHGRGGGGGDGGGGGAGAPLDVGDGDVGDGGMDFDVERDAARDGACRSQQSVGVTSLPRTQELELTAPCAGDRRRRAP